MSCEPDWENPHTFKEAVAYLNAGNHIDYEVRIGDHQGALMTFKTWLEAVADKSFIDYDGYGDQIGADGTYLGDRLSPSRAKDIRQDCAYILWYNR